MAAILAGPTAINPYLRRDPTNVPKDANPAALLVSHNGEKLDTTNSTHLPPIRDDLLLRLPASPPNGVNRLLLLAEPFPLTPTQLERRSGAIASSSYIPGAPYRRASQWGGHGRAPFQPDHLIR